MFASWDDAYLRGKSFAFVGCAEETCPEKVLFLPNPKTGRLVPICDLHGQNHFRCCTNPGRF